MKTVKKHLLVITIMITTIFTGMWMEDTGIISAYALQASDIHFVTYNKDQEYQTEAVDAANGEYNLLIPESDFQSMGTLGERARVMIESGTNLWHSTNATLYLKHEANASTLKALAAGGKLYIKSKEEAEKADYTYSVIKCAVLTSLSVNGREIVPDYTCSEDSYTVAVADKKEKITVNVGTTPAATRAITVNNKNVNLTNGEGSIQLNCEELIWNEAGKATIPITVSDTALSKGSTYTLNIETNPQVRILSQSETSDKTYYDNEESPSTMSISAVAPTEISYQWYVSNQQDLSGAQKIESATSKQYTPDIQKLDVESETRYYYCEVKNTVDESNYTARSNAWKVIINKGVYPTVSVSAQDGIRIENNEISVDAREDKIVLFADVKLPDGYSEEQGTISYQWYVAHTNENVPAVNGTSNRLECYAAGDSVTSYYCCVTYTSPDNTKFTTKSETIKVSVFGFKENYIEYRAGWSGYKDTTVKVGKSGKVGIHTENCVGIGSKLYAQWFASSDGENYTQLSEPEQCNPSKEIMLNAPIKTEARVDYYYCKLTFECDSVARPGETVRTERSTTPIKITTKGVDVLEGFNGKGTIDSPFLIKDIKDLQLLKDKVNKDGYTCYGVYFRLDENITIPQKGWTPIGTVNTFFSGHINGNGKTLTIEENGKPLLGYVREASVSNLNLFGKKINGNGLVDNYVVDRATRETIRITNVTIKEGTNIVKSGLIGGYASGVNNVYITNCKIESGVVIGCNKNLDNIGGFAGEFNGYIMNCVNEGEVYGRNFVGGIIADKGQCMGFCNIRNSVFSGKVVATGNYAGGISGGGYGGTTWGIESAPNTPCITIQNCISSGSISGKNYVGGILGAEPGVVQCWENGKGYVTDNLFVGKVSATDANAYVGGIIGYFNSINKYTTISNNYFADTCDADKGIGQIMLVDTSCATANTADSTVKYIDTSSYKDYGELRKAAKEVGFEGIERFKHNRIDDPLGADADSLTKKVSSEELQNETISKLLNDSSTSFKNWVQGSEYPVHSNKPVVYAIELSGEYKTEYKIGDSFSKNKMTIIGKVSDGSTRTIQISDPKLKFTGYNLNQHGVQTVTVTYGVAETTYEIRVLYNESQVQKVLAYFTLLGDSNHSEPTNEGGPHTLSSKNLKTWVERTKVVIDNNTSVFDVFKKVLKQNKIDWKGSADNKYNTMYISGVQIPGSKEYLEEFTNGSNSGWMYTLNGRHPSLGVAQQFLNNGDEIVFHYTDDYTKEEGSEKWNTPGGAVEEVKDVTTDTKKGTTTAPTDVRVSEKTNADGTKTKVAEVKISADNQKEVLKQAKASKSKEIILNVSSKSVGDAEKADVTLDKSFIESIVKDTDAKLTIRTPFGDKTYTQDELKAMSEAANDSTVTVAIEKAAEEPTDDAAVKMEKAKSIVKDLKLVARSSTTAKKNIKAVLKSDAKTKASVQELKDLGFTVKYRFYRSTKKAAAYKAAVTKKTASYTNTGGKKGTKYFYKVQVRVYDENGKLIAKTALKQCKYATRTWSKAK